LALFFASGKRRAILAVIFLAVAGAAALLGIESKSEEEKREEALAKVSESVDGTADAASRGVDLYFLRLSLEASGEAKRFKIRRIEPNDGGYTISTTLPPGEASIRKVDRLCRELLGGDPPRLEAPDGILVFGTGPEPLSGESCGQGP